MLLTGRPLAFMFGLLSSIPTREGQCVEQFSVVLCTHSILLRLCEGEKQMFVALGTVGHIYVLFHLCFFLLSGDGQVDFDEFMTILGPKLVSSEGRDGFLGNTIDSIFWQVGGISF